MEEAKTKKAKQLSERKKMFKNRPMMPRTVTAGQRTVGDMTRTLERAGYDASKLRAHVIAAKAIASEHRKRKRAHVDDGMDVDASQHDDSEYDGMDVDGEATAAPKRVKDNTGSVMGRSRLPQSNRQIAGLKNAEVGGYTYGRAVGLICVCTLISKQAKHSGCGTSVNESVTTTLEQGKAIVPLRQKWSDPLPECRNLPALTCYLHSQSISSLASAKQAKQTADDHNSVPANPALASFCMRIIFVSEYLYTALYY